MLQRRSPVMLIAAFCVIFSSLTPVPRPLVGQTGEGPSTVSYVLRHQSAEKILQVFQPLVANEPGVQLRADADKKRIVLSGPDWAHELFEQVLQRVDREAKPVQPEARPSPIPAAQLQQPRLRAPPTADSSPPADSRPSADSQRGEPVGPVDVELRRRLVNLPTGKATAMRRDLLELLGGRLRIPPDPKLPWSINTPQGPLRIDFDLAREDVLLDGPANVIDQFSQLLTVVAQKYLPRRAEQAGGQSQRVLLLRREVQAEVEMLLESSQHLLRQEDSTLNAGMRLNGGARQATASLRQGADLIVRLAGAQQPPAETPPAQKPPVNQQEGEQQQGEQVPGDNRAGENILPLNPALPQLDGVEIELLPDLDAIILKGRDQDLQQLAEIIRELEQISRETQPAVEIVRLRHTNSTQIAELIADTQQDLLGTRQGRAQLTPLGKPNALLLIGWGEAVETLRSLIGKLDQPLAAETQFRLFRIKYAVATDLQQTIDTFFSARDGALAPQVQATVDQRTNTLIVHAAPRDMVEVQRMVQELDTQSGRFVQRTRIFPIRNSLASDVADTLRETVQPTSAASQAAAMELLLDDPQNQQVIVSGILENIQITVDVRKNNLIVSAPADAFDVLAALIDVLDSPSSIAKIKIFPIRNSDAASLVETLRSLLPSQAGGDPVSSAQLSSAPGESSLAPLRFTVDVRSNSIIASGSDGDLTIVDALVTRLDETDTMQRQNTVYQLKNSPAVDVALAINEFLRNTRQVENASPGTINPYDQLEKEVVVVPEPVSNKLIVSATPRYFEEISKMIEKLDAQPPQVMIQALIAEIALDNTEEFGVELGIQDSVLFDRGLLGELLTVTNTVQNSTPGGVQTATNQEIVAATNQPGFDFNNTNSLGNSGSNRALAGAGTVGPQAISNFAVGRGNAELGFGGLVLSASSQNINVLLRALEETRRMEILSRPQVLTLDNQPAFIQVGQRVPRITGSSINQIGQQNTVELENVGLILGVTPRISPEGNVTMEIDAEKSSIGPEIEGIPVSVSNDGTIIRSPRVDVTSAQATVSAADGETIILGGLITKSRREVHRKVPYLGDIPVLRHLFRFDSMSVRRTELLIILTPHIVRTPADAERLKQIEMARMSWCAADVFDLHGEVYHEADTSLLFSQEDEGVQVIYPHVDPRGAAKISPQQAADYPMLGPVSPPNLQTSEDLPSPPAKLQPPVVSGPTAPADFTLPPSPRGNSNSGSPTPVPSGR
ncbi:secretin N-terminal domain-containing protein [Planctomycetaceae bacterium SH139]